MNNNNRVLCDDGGEVQYIYIHESRIECRRGCFTSVSRFFIIFIFNSTAVFQRIIIFNENLTSPRPPFSTRTTVIRFFNIYTYDMHLYNTLRHPATLMVYNILYCVYYWNYSCYRDKNIKYKKLQKQKKLVCDNSYINDA